MQIMNLLDLPTEIILKICKQLSDREKYNLLIANKQLSKLLNQVILTNKYEQEKVIKKSWYNQIANLNNINNYNKLPKQLRIMRLNFLFYDNFENGKINTNYNYEKIINKNYIYDNLCHIKNIKIYKNFNKLANDTKIFNYIKKLKKLTINDSDYDDENNIFRNGCDISLLPKSLKKLKILEIKVINFDFSIFNNLQTLIIDTQVDQKFVKFPESLKKLKIYGKYNQPFEPNILPKKLKTLDFSSYTEYDEFALFNQKFEKGILPDSLEELILGSDYKQEFEIDVLPKGLKKLEFGWEYNIAIKQGVLPNLQVLIFGPHFDEKLEVGVLPNSIEILIFRSYSHVFDVGILPNKLISLIFEGSRYNQPFGKNVLPNTLKHLSFESTFYGHDTEYCAFNQKFIEDVLPESLEILNLGFAYNQIFEENILPKNLKKLLYYSRECQCSVSENSEDDKSENDNSQDDNSQDSDEFCDKCSYRPISSELHLLYPNLKLIDIFRVGELHIYLDIDKKYKVI